MPASALTESERVVLRNAYLCTKLLRAAGRGAFLNKKEIISELKRIGSHDVVVDKQLLLSARRFIGNCSKRPLASVAIKSMVLPSGIGGQLLHELQVYEKILFRRITANPDLREDVGDLISGEEEQHTGA